MKAVTKYKAESGKVYDTEVEAEMDDTLGHISAMIYDVCGDERVTAAFVDFIKYDDDINELVFQIESYHQLKTQNEGKHI